MARTPRPSGPRKRAVKTEEIKPRPTRQTRAPKVVATAFVNARYAGYEVDADRWPALREYLARQFASPLFERRLAQEAAYLASASPR